MGAVLSRKVVSINASLTGLGGCPRRPEHERLLERRFSASPRQLPGAFSGVSIPEMLRGHHDLI